MDRARRIRELREGGRTTEAEQDDNSVTEEDAPGAAEEGKAAVEAPEGETDETDSSPADESLATGNSEESTDDQPAVSVPTVTDIETAPTDVTAELAGDSSGVSAPLPDADMLEAALDEADADTEAETVGPAVDQDEEEEDEQETRVLEFTLDGEHFCLDIEYIEEIVKKETITRVPNTPEYVEGVVDLRGQITTILNPKVILETEQTDASELIIVFDADSFDDQGNVGWVVDDVRQVSPITPSDVNDPPVADDHINGVIDRDDDDEFVIWTTPELTMQDEAEG